MKSKSSCGGGGGGEGEEEGEEEAGIDENGTGRKEGSSPGRQVGVEKSHTTMRIA